MLQEREQDRATAEGELKVLQWIYGNIVNSSAEEFLERRRELLAERQPDLVMLELVEDMAECWRHLRDANERRRHLKFLRWASLPTIRRYRGQALGKVQPCTVLWRACITFQNRCEESSLRFLCHCSHICAPQNRSQAGLQGDGEEVHARCAGAGGAWPGWPRPAEGRA